MRLQALFEEAARKKDVNERLTLLQTAAQLCSEHTELGALTPASRRQMATIYFALGRELYQQGKWQRAVVHLEKAVFVDSTFFSAQTLLGLLHFQQRKYDAAIVAYVRVLRAQPSAQLYNNLGAAQESKGDLNAAVEAYRRALDLDPKLFLAQKNLQRVKEKIALAKPLPAPQAQAVASDSALRAEKQRDSLAAVAQKPAITSTRTKSAKNQRPDKTGAARKNSAATNVPVAAKREPEVVSSKSHLLPAETRSNAAANSLGRPSPVKGDSVQAMALLPAQSLSKPVLDETVAPLRSSSFNAVTPPSGSSSRSLFAYICGAGAVLVGVFIFAQRRRLGRVWLQLKPALAISPAAVRRERRLLPALFERHAVNNNKHGEDEIQLPLNQLLAAPKSVEAETPESAHATNTDNAEDTEANQPSLQTQAFFAEIIAAEPEIDEFEEQNKIQSDEADSTTKSSETPVEAPASVEPSAVAPNEAGAGEIPAMTSAPVAGEIPSTTSAPEALLLPTRNEKNGDINLLQPSVETVDKPTTSSAVIEISTSSQKLESFPVTNNGKDSSLLKSSEPATTSQGAAVIPGRRDSQSQPGEDPVPAVQQVLGRYLVEREIGKGAMGKIYLAYDPKLDRRVVIKTVCFNLASCDTEISTLKDRVYREARAIAKLSHPNIVVVYDVEDDKEMSYIVMEHIEGRDLRQTLKSERRLDYQRAITIVAQVCSALDYAHQAGIVHRDIKPSNIMLLPNDKAKVTDFGIAKIADNFSLTLPGHVLGTPSYMAPEQFDGETLDGRADLFSLGVVFYELLTGTRPFVGDSVASLAYKIVHKMHIPPSLQNVELPLELDEITGRALAKQPEARYQTAKEFREALVAIKFEMAV